MKTYTIYENATGQIVDNLTCPDNHAVNLNDGEGVLDGHFPDDEFCVVDGVPAPLVQIKAADLTEVEGGSLNVLTAEDEARIVRNQMLIASDWTQVADAPVDHAAWADYRKALRNITSQDGFPENVVWPAQPV